MGWVVAFERALVISYRPSIVTFHLSLRVSDRDIAAFCAPARHFFPTTPLVSPKFPHVPMWMSFGLRRVEVLG